MLALVERVDVDGHARRPEATDELEQEGVGADLFFRVPVRGEHRLVVGARLFGERAERLAGPHLDEHAPGRLQESR